MKNRYLDLIEQTFYFPTEGFRVEDDNLIFNDIPLMDLVEQYGSPLRLTYLPKISSQIQKAKKNFANAMQETGYKGKYNYCYCTKSNHFSFVLEEALKNDIHIETSYAYDIDLIGKLYQKGWVNKETFFVHNGFKQQLYTDKISELINSGFKNVIPVLDNMAEIEQYGKAEGEVNFGIRIAADEEPNFEFYTSRLGIRYKDIISFYKEKIETNPKYKLKMLHFFINTGIKDATYYWSELNKAVKLYTELKKINPDLKYMNIGGGFPIRNSIHFEYDYAYMTMEIVKSILSECQEAGVEEPDIFTEFGKYTVGEAGAIIYSVLGEKWQNDNELWYMINNSLMTTVPDAWGIGERFILLPVNNWHSEYQKVNIGGLSCDGQDYYNSEAHANQVYLPKLKKGETMHIGFFHVGAYQESLSGYGGIKHCLIPAPQHVLVKGVKDGKIDSQLFAEKQEVDKMLGILGY